jgi:hypothetical protein
MRFHNRPRHSLRYSLTFVLYFYSPLKLLLFHLAIVQNVLICIHYSSHDYSRTTVRSVLEAIDSDLWSISGHWSDGQRMDSAILVLGER